MMPRIGPVRAAQDVTPEAANQVLFHYGYGGYRAGSFFAALLEAWDKADMINSAKLAQAFPGHAAALSILGEDHRGVDALHQVGRESEGPKSITCPRCGRTSWNPNDVAEGYCGYCHDWTRDGSEETNV